MNENSVKNCGEFEILFELAREFELSEFEIPGFYCMAVVFRVLDF